VQLLYVNVLRSGIMIRFKSISLSVVVISVASCATAPEVTKSFSERCLIIKNPVFASATSKHRAVQELKKLTLSLNGDTLVMGEDGLRAVKDHENAMAREAILATYPEARRHLIHISDDDLGPVEAVKARDGETVYWGAVLECGKINI
jgi:hypothetical protein